MSDPWGLIKAKQYQAAIEEYSRLLQSEPARMPYLANRGTAYLLSGNYIASLVDFRAIIETSHPDLRGDDAYINAGICCWYLDRPNEALAFWRDGLDAPYTDAAGGVELPALLLYAGKRLGISALQKDALDRLDHHWRKLLRRPAWREATRTPVEERLVFMDLLFWPEPIVPLLLGHIDSSTVLRIAQECSSETLRTRRRCAVDFHVALRALIQSQKLEFEESMRNCAASTYGELEPEFYLAKWEVDRQFPNPPFP